MGCSIERKPFSLHLIRTVKMSPLTEVLLGKNKFMFNWVTCKLIFSSSFQQYVFWSESSTENSNWPRTCLVILGCLTAVFPFAKWGTSGPPVCVWEMLSNMLPPKFLQWSLPGNGGVLGVRSKRSQALCVIFK